MPCRDQKNVLVYSVTTDYRRALSSRMRAAYQEPDAHAHAHVKERSSRSGTAMRDLVPLQRSTFELGLPRSQLSPHGQPAYTNAENVPARTPPVCDHLQTNHPDTPARPPRPRRTFPFVRSRTSASFLRCLIKHREETASLRRLYWSLLVYWSEDYPYRKACRNLPVGGFRGN